MESSILREITQLVREHKTAARVMAVFLCLAVVVTAATVGVLTFTGHAMTEQVKVLTCPYTVHQHTQACKNAEGEIVCGYADYVVHIHNDDCYDENGALVCPLPEVWPHTHSDSCYTEVKNVVCGLEETPGHVHTQECYDRQQGDLICTLAEHTHGPECYYREEVLTCDKTEQEHVHGPECYTVTRDLTCGQEESEEHTHSDACYTETQVLICDKTMDPHTHGPECYTVNETLICEIPEHTHSDECYNWTETLICEIPEGQIPEGGHVHTEACYETTTQLTCGKLENHEHTDECFTLPDGSRSDVPICGKIELLEHVHGDDCFTIEEREVDADALIFFESTGEDPEAEPAAPEYICGLEEHTHDDTCLDENGEIVCGKEEHTHDESCIAPAEEAEGPEEPEEAAAPEYICGKEEHTHDDTCLDENGEIVCGKEEHTHDESCVAPAEEAETVYYCGKEEHTHDESCQDEAGEIVCGMEEHVHDASCLVEPAPEGMVSQTYQDGDVLITAVYGPEAQLPEGAALRAERIAPEADPAAYEEYLTRMKAAAGDIDVSTVVLYDIGFYLPDGTEVEPQAMVNVSIRFLDGGKGDSESMTVVHFTEEDTEVLESVSEAGSVTFDTDSFSVFSFLAGILKDTDGGTYGIFSTIANNDLNDLENYIKDMTIQKWDEEKDEWVDLAPGEDVVLGNNYRLKVHFEPAAGGKFQNPMTWDLGDSVKCQPETGANVFGPDGVTSNGKYSLTEDGKLEVNFTEEFLGTTGQSLDMTFDFVPTGDPEGGTAHYPWEDHITDHQVLDNTGVLNVEKTAGWYSNSNGTIEYTVKAEVTAGMVKNGKLVDVMGDGLTFRSLTDIRVYDANGKDVTSEYQKTIDDLKAQAKEHEGKGNSNWTLKPLPDLTQGMYVEVKYYGQVGDSERTDMNYVAENTVTLTGEKPDVKHTPAEPATDTAEKPLARDQLKKSGNVITVTEKNGEEKDVIQWEVQVGSGQWDPLSTRDGKNQDLTMVDTLGEGLSFREGEPFYVEWYDEDGNLKGRGQIPWEDKIVVDGNKATYVLSKDLFKDKDYNWKSGDYLRVTYNTDFDPTQQPKDGFKNTIENEILGKNGTTGRLPVGEAIQKRVEDREEDGYLIYTIEADVPAASYMKSMKDDKGDGHPELDLPYFYIEDRLDFGDTYFAMNIPQDVTVIAKEKTSGDTYEFKQVPWNTYVDTADETFDIIEGPNSSTSDEGKVRRAFRIFFNTARYGLGTEGELEKHDSIWDITEPTHLTITYRIPYSTPLVNLDGTDAHLTLGQALNGGYEMENKACYRRSGIDDLDSSVYTQKTPKEGEIDKSAQVMDGDVVEYRVKFVNSHGDSSRWITGGKEGDQETDDRHYKKSNPTLIDVFDKRMEYVPGSLRVEVFSEDGKSLYGVYQYQETDPVSINAEGNPTLKVKLTDDNQWTQTWNDGSSKDNHYVLEGRKDLTDTFNDTRTFVFVYQLRLKDGYRDSWDDITNIVNYATFTFGGQSPKDSTSVNLPSDMLQKSFITTEDHMLQYTLEVNSNAIDLVTELGEQKTNLDSYKLVDSMSDNLQLLTNSDGAYMITVEYKGEDGSWIPLDRSSSPEGISRGAYNYFLGSEEGNDIYFILPDELAIRITYKVRVNGAENSHELATNTATLYADHTESDEKKTVFEVGSSSAQSDGVPPVRVEKTDASSGGLLKNAKFALYSDEAGESRESITVTDGSGKTIRLYKVKEYVTDEFGTIANIVPVETDSDYDGLYALIEIEAPANYVLDPTPHFFRFPAKVALPDDPETVTYGSESYEVKHMQINGTIEIENTHDAYELPETGGFGDSGLYLAGAVLIATGAGLLVLRKRKGARA